MCAADATPPQSGRQVMPTRNNPLIFYIFCIGHDSSRACRNSHNSSTEDACPTYEVFVADGKPDASPWTWYDVTRAGEGAKPDCLSGGSAGRRHSPALSKDVDEQVVTEVTRRPCAVDQTPRTNSLSYYTGHRSHCSCWIKVLVSSSAPDTQRSVLTDRWTSSSVSAGRQLLTGVGHALRWAGFGPGQANSVTSPTCFPTPTPTPAHKASSVTSLTGFPTPTLTPLR